MSNKSNTERSEHEENLVNKIVIWPKRVLDNLTSEVDFKVDSVGYLKKLVEEMEQVIVRTKGVGLAANQVGVPLQMAVVVSNPDSYSREGTDPEFLTLINPRVVVYFGEPYSSTEGCLSLPGQSFEVTRYPSLAVTYSDFDQTEIRRKFEGFLATIVQHEYDHLRGKLICTGSSYLKKEMLRSKMANIERSRKKGFSTRQEKI